MTTTNTGWLRARTREEADLHSGGMQTIELVKYFRRKGSKTDVAAIDGVSITVEPGELVVLLGPSGCGKTTILRCIAGLESPNSGEIVVDGRTVYSGAQKLNVPVNKRNTSVIFQGYALWPHMSVADNIGYPLESAGVKRPSIRERVKTMLALVGVPDLGKEYPGTLSGGQQQRVSLARALVSDPPIVLFDEPLSNVDAQVRHTLRRQIKAMHRRVGFSAIYVTHDQEEALSLADRIVVLSKGKVVQDGTPDEVYNSPNSKYVAEFVGRANVFPVTLGDEPGKVSAVFGPLAVSTIIEPAAAAQQWAVLRAEAIELADEDEVSSGEINVIDATVRSAEFLGARSECIVEAGDVSLRVELPRGAAIPRVGASIRLRVPARALRVVPA